MTADYEFLTRWRVTATLAEVKAVLGDGPSLPRWWPAVFGYALAATGDLVGSGRWTFLPTGSDVVILYDWRVRASKPLLQQLTWLLRPAFAANHRWAMASGEESLRLELRRRRATTEAERRRVPPPPPGTFRWLVGRGG